MFPDHLTGTARQYIFIIIAGMLATFLYDTCAASLRALGDTVTPLVILAVSVTLNIAGDLLFYSGSKSRSSGSCRCHGTFTDAGISYMLVLHDPQV